MNEIPKFAAPRTVTTGPIAGSRKVYAAPSGRADIRVPLDRKSTRLNSSHRR